MAFQEGHQKVGGRTAGTPNRTTKEIRTALKSVVQKEVDNLHTIFEGLEAPERAELLIKLLPYVMPKVEAVHYTEGEGVFADWP